MSLQENDKQLPFNEINPKLLKSKSKRVEEPKEDITIINLSNIKAGHIDKIINESAKFKTGSEVLNESIKKSIYQGGSTFGKG